MNNEHKKRSLLDGYVGVKFEVIQRSEEPPSQAAALYRVFRRVGDRLKAHHMAPANAGNISVRYGRGLLITASACNLGCIQQNEVIFVEQCDVGAECVVYCGPLKPSSESIMHWLIYEDRPEVGAVIHAHDEFATRPELLAGVIQESEREEPYGTIELARMAIESFERAKRIIVLKNHGYVAIGSDLNSICDLIVSTHLRLLEKSRDS
jgi:L-fuculose-phosphate aldolase